MQSSNAFKQTFQDIPLSEQNQYPSKNRSNQRKIMSKKQGLPILAAQNIYAYLAVLLLASSFALSFIIPDFLKSISREDHFLENLSTGLLLGTAFFGFINWKQKQANTTAIAVYTILAIIGFLDEVSFGQRLIGFTPPMAGGTSLDGFHDLANMLRKIISVNLQYHPSQTIIVIVAFLSLFLIFTFKHRSKIRSVYKHLKQLNLEYVVLSIILAIFLSQLLDLKAINLSWSTCLEEILELIAALGLLTCLATTVKESRP